VPPLGIRRSRLPPLGIRRRRAGRRLRRRVARSVGAAQSTVEHGGVG